MTNLFKFRSYSPAIADGVFVAPNASVIGNVEIKENSSIWFGTVVRGDLEKITIGSGTNIQDLSVLHVATNFPLTIGDNVTVGHHVNLHACKIGSGSLIGIGSIVLDGVEIGENSIVAAGTIISPGKKFPPRSFIIGTPGVLKREITDDEIKNLRNAANIYLELVSEYTNS